MQELSGDSTSIASLPKSTPTDHKSEASRGRGRPVTENVKIPWQVLELASGSGGGCSGGSMGEMMNVEDPNRSEGLRGLVSHKRKLSNELHISPRFLPSTHLPRLVHPQPVSPPKSPAQKEAQDEPAAQDDLPASGDVVEYSSDVAAEEKIEMEVPSAAAIADKGKVMESSDTTKEKVVKEEPSDVAGEKCEMESSDAEKTDSGNGPKKILFDLNELPAIEDPDMP